LSTLNWRRDPGYEQRRIRHEQRMQQIESEILQIEKETEQLRRENAREKALSALIRQRCFPSESSSIPPTASESDCGSSWSWGETTNSRNPTTRVKQQPVLRD
jgi:hypothetical protein